MTQLTLRPTGTAARFAAAALLIGCATPALAQVQPDRPEPGQIAPVAPQPKPHASSSLGATADTPTEAREGRTLAGAVFARPAAAARAADKATAATQPDLAAQVQPKAEWTATKPPLVGGRGIELSKPF